MRETIITLEEFIILAETTGMYEKEAKAIKTLLQAYKAQDKVIDEIKSEIREHIGFENRLKREDKEPDLFNQGRFYVANNIKEIINKVKENKEQ